MHAGKRSLLLKFLELCLLLLVLPGEASCLFLQPGLCVNFGDMEHEKTLEYTGTLCSPLYCLESQSFFLATASVNHHNHVVLLQSVYVNGSLVRIFPNTKAGVPGKDYEFIRQTCFETFLCQPCNIPQTFPVESPALAHNILKGRNLVQHFLGCNILYIIILYYTHAL